MTMTNREYELLTLWLSIGFIGCGALFALCLMPNTPGPDAAYFDKVEHFTAYLFLGAWFAALVPHLYWRVLIGLAAFGAIIEFAQWFSGYRDAEFADWVADALGTAAGIGLANLGVMAWLGYIDQRVAARRHSAR